MAEITFRPARLLDANDIKFLIRLVRINPMGLNWRRFLLAISDNGELVGCAQIKPHSDGTFELASLAVRREWRGRGIARTLIEKLLSNSPRPIYLICRSGLGDFYGKFGFSVPAFRELPPYFRRLKSLANIFFYRKKDETLLIMRRDA